MTMNGHFANVGDAPTKEQYEHGIQVIDEDKEFKYYQTASATAYLTDTLPVLTSTPTFNLPKLHSPASTTILSQSLAPSQQESLPCLTTCLARNLV